MIKLAVFAAILIFQHSNAQPPLVSDHDKLNSQVSSWLSSVDAESVDLNEISKKILLSESQALFPSFNLPLPGFEYDYLGRDQAKMAAHLYHLTQLLKEMSAGFEPNIISNILNAPPVDQVLLSDKSISRTPNQFVTALQKKFLQRWMKNIKRAIYDKPATDTQPPLSRKEQKKAIFLIQQQALRLSPEISNLTNRFYVGYEMATLIPNQKPFINDALSDIAEALAQRIIAAALIKRAQIDNTLRFLNSEYISMTSDDQFLEKQINQIHRLLLSTYIIVGSSRLNRPNKKGMFFSQDRFDSVLANQALGHFWRTLSRTIFSYRIDMRYLSPYWSNFVSHSMRETYSNTNDGLDMLLSEFLNAVNDIKHLTAPSSFRCRILF